MKSKRLYLTGLALVCVFWAMALQAQLSKVQEAPAVAPAPETAPAVQAAVGAAPMATQLQAPVLAQAAPPKAAVAAPASSPKEDLVQMTFTDTNLQDVLRSLTALRPGVNIVMDPDVKGKVALLSLHDVTWEKALQIVADSNSLEIVQEPGNIYRVRRAATSTDEKIAIKLLTLTDVGALTDEQVTELLSSREADLRITADQQRERLRQTAQNYIKELKVRDATAVEVIQALAEKSDLNLAFTPVAEDPDTTKPATPITLKLKNMPVIDALRLVAAQGGLSCNIQNGVWVVLPRPPAKTAVEPLILETFQVNFLALDDGLIKLCQGLISERGQVSAGKNKILVVQDSADGVEAVRRTLEVMDKPTPQVLIEARFYELNKLSSRDLGIDWSQLGADGKGIVFSTSLSPLDFSRNGWDKDDSATNKRIATATIDFGDLAGIIKALEANNGAREISNPKVLVSSDEQATIHIGEQRPILKASLDSAPGGDVITVFELDPAYGGEQVQDEQLVEREKYEKDRSYTVRKGYLDLGTKLTVAPSVKTENEVYIKVVPELTTILGEKEITSTTGLTVEYPILFSTRVRTEFTIQSTQTIAIGGLVSERNEKGERKVPVLGSIPGLGRLFRYDFEDKKRTETIIFLTVTVIPSREMTLTSGIPVKSKLIQEELPVIRHEDARGPGYLSPSAEYMSPIQGKAQPKPDAQKPEVAAESQEATPEAAAETMPRAVQEVGAPEAGENAATRQPEAEGEAKLLPPIRQEIQQSIEKAAKEAALIMSSMDS